MPLSLTPNPDHETEDLATPLTTPFIMRALHEHGTTVTEFELEKGWHGRDWPHQPTLQELRDFLNY